MTEYIFPTRIVKASLSEGAEALLDKKVMQIGLSEKSVTRFENGDYVIIDFGVEMNGGIRILTYLSDKGRVRIRFGESLGECCADIGGKQNATNDHAIRDFITVLPSYSDMTFGNTGFRFVRLDFYGSVQVKSIIAVNHIFNKKVIYSYSGSDRRITDIYLTAKRTVDLCVQNGYVWDGAKRDRLVWVGDMHPEMLALTTLYGRVFEIERSLDFAREQAPLPSWMNNCYPTYSMWWIIILADYFEKSGARRFTKRQLGYLSGLVSQLNECVDENGTMNYPSYFVDWQTSGSSDELHGARAINIIAAKKAIALLNAFGKDVSVAEKLLSKLMKVEISPKDKIQVLGLKYFAVGLSEDDKSKLLANGAEGMTTFMSYYILKAVASFDKKAAIDMMKDYYGAMLDCGATTFWEDFNIAWTKNASRIDAFPKKDQKDIHGDFGSYCYKGFRHSLCHGWSSGVLQFIKEECL